MGIAIVCQVNSVIFISSRAERWLRDFNSFSSRSKHINAQFELLNKKKKNEMKCKNEYES